jgi:hypothetical protein
VTVVRAGPLGLTLACRAGPVAVAGRYVRMPRPVPDHAGTDFSPERAMQALSTIRLVSLRLEDQAELRGVSGGCPDALRVLKALKLTDWKPPPQPKGEASII